MDGLSILLGFGAAILLWAAADSYTPPGWKSGLAKVGAVVGALLVIAVSTQVLSTDTEVGDKVCFEGDIYRVTSVENGEINWVPTGDICHPPEGGPPPGLP